MVTWIEATIGLLALVLGCITCCLITGMLLLGMLFVVYPSLLGLIIAVLWGDEEDEPTRV